MTNLNIIELGIIEISRVNTILIINPKTRKKKKKSVYENENSVLLPAYISIGPRIKYDTIIIKIGGNIVSQFDIINFLMFWDTSFRRYGT